MTRTSYPHRVVAEGLGFPEGPVVCPDGSVILCEIKARRLTRIHPDGSRDVLCQLEEAPNGAALGADGALYICNNGDGFAWGAPGGVTQPVGGNPAFSGGRIERVDLATGTVTELYRSIGGHDLLMPNDIVIDRDGGLWFTDHGTRTARSFVHGGLYYGRPDGSFACEVAWPITTANGVGLSPDEKTVYVADTETGRLYSYAVTGPGTIVPPDPYQPGAAVLAQLKGFRRYDSLAVEACGNICCAGLTPGCISVISPAGEEVETVEMPDPFSTNIAFGGPDMRTAYVTLSGSGRLIAVDWPRPGLKPNFSGL
ncbi:SMP-30/gluconolactonase/LRE family protein [Pseudooceanicola sp. CBS1P-1]|uniref:SMP-30/gluconolactonase/LRE family protein n=1 Tax=Pseudooceanicola albus TaxID=2692189 RepID=A0A6L7G7M4_9RHOB|nr:MULTISPECIES: SMP-30/gluconolactonase/LRE family protein [Pseudooceanicola]MBT9386021.1 SMP-30/gluconolactonase/LRE family protein [Pseudooceanicola endophyticus]MXN19558.1 SMP-30/gluconolactonase/LRE family protein [Pseudooceanicola albus]